MGEWKLEFDAPAGKRLAKRFIGVNAYPLWWDEEYRRWVVSEEIAGRVGSNTCHVRSLKAFKRHLRKHPELRAAENVKFVSCFVGFDVYAKPPASPDRPQDSGEKLP